MPVETSNVSVEEFVKDVESSGQEGVPLAMRACEKADALPREARAEAWHELYRRHPSLQMVLDFIKPEITKTFGMPSWQSCAAQRQAKLQIISTYDQPVPMAEHIARIIASAKAPAASGSPQRTKPSAPAATAVPDDPHTADLKARYLARMAKHAATPAAPAPAAQAPAPAAAEPPAPAKPVDPIVAEVQRQEQHLAAARIYQREHGGTLGEALQATMPPPPPADPRATACADHLARAEKYRAEHRCSLREALSFTAAA